MLGPGRRTGAAARRAVRPVSTATAAAKGDRCTSPAADLGILGTNGIVGASIGIATGAALAAQLDRCREVGQRPVLRGQCDQPGHVPRGAQPGEPSGIYQVVYVCRNNHFAQSAAIEGHGGRSIGLRRARHGLRTSPTRVWPSNIWHGRLRRTGRGPGSRRAREARRRPKAWSWPIPGATAGTWSAMPTGYRRQANTKRLVIPRRDPEVSRACCGASGVLGADLASPRNLACSKKHVDAAQRRSRGQKRLIPTVSRRPLPTFTE